MKKLLLSAITAIALSCSSNNDDAPAVVAEDCNCDRVVEATTYNVVGTPQSPALNYATYYITINDCTGVQKERTHTTTVSSEIPKIGQCK
jgi:hypothetical protein